MLFLIYINDLPNCTDERLRLFADDANASITLKNPNILKQKAINTIKNINEWLNANKLLISMPKTCYSIFAAENKIIPGYLNNIKIGQNVINRTDTAKYLGIIIDYKLNWHAHIEH